MGEGRRITGAARDKLAAQLKAGYEAGATIRALAEANGRSYGFVHALLLQARVTLRGRGGATRRQKGTPG
ncbi:helix-turn-helix domain-containing protein [Streptomyces sp. 21So2-11]|uniref:helix-turn-helix domain-containing protein n=1 Tax=Streptomyces sp. 21So2-11 TaxID=3144408 RepID=UPI00321A5294